MPRRSDPGRRATSATPSTAVAVHGDVLSEPGGEFYRSLVHAMAQIVWTADAQGHVRDISAWRELTGQSEHEFRDRGWQAALHDDDRVRVAAEWTAAVEQQYPFRTEYR